jgi:hypothetical protein
MVTFFLFLVKRENSEYYTLVGYSNNHNINEIKNLILDNRNHCFVKEIISHKILDKQMYDDISKTYTVYDVGNIDFVHIDSEILDFNFVKKVIEKNLNNKYVEDMKYQLHRPALECFPIQNRSMVYYLKVYIEHLLKPVFTSDTEFKFTFFNVNTVRDTRNLSGYMYSFTFKLTLKKGDKFYSYDYILSNVGEYDNYQLTIEFKTDNTDLFEGYEYMYNNPYIDNTYIHNSTNFLRGTNCDPNKAFIDTNQYNNIDDGKYYNMDDDNYDKDYLSACMFEPLVDELNKYDLLRATQYRDSNY